MEPRYDRIGRKYATRRRPDPRLEALITDALGDARTVVNVGAGAGSYEPVDRVVLAVEPSAVMAAQRPADSPAIRATAQALPLHDASVDAAMTVLSVHHWHPDQEAGIREMCRVARDRVVIVTVDPRVCGRMWLMADYFPEVRALDDVNFPLPEDIVAWLDRPAQVHVVPTPADPPDHTLMSFWAHPERVLDPAARAATSGFSRQPPEVVDRVVTAVRRDLQDGTWDARHGHLRRLEALDVGVRVIVGGAG